MQVVGRMSKRVIALLGLPYKPNVLILLGDTNIQHMKTSHPADYARYGADIPLILAEPDYVGLNPSDGSVEFVKEYSVNGEHVKVAVRLSAAGKLYARSIYVLNKNRVQNFITKGTLKRV